MSELRGTGGVDPNSKSIAEQSQMLAAGNESAPKGSSKDSFEDGPQDAVSFSKLMTTHLSSAAGAASTGKGDSPVPGQSLQRTSSADAVKSQDLQVPAADDGRDVVPKRSSIKDKSPSGRNSSNGGSETLNLDVETRKSSSPKRKPRISRSEEKRAGVKSSSSKSPRRSATTSDQNADLEAPGTLSKHRKSRDSLKPEGSVSRAEKTPLNKKRKSQTNPSKRKKRSRDGGDGGDDDDDDDDDPDDDDDDSDDSDSDTDSDSDDDSDGEGSGGRSKGKNKRKASKNEKQRLKAAETYYEQRMKASQQVRLLLRNLIRLELKRDGLELKKKKLESELRDLSTRDNSSHGQSERSHKLKLLKAALEDVGETIDRIGKMKLDLKRFAVGASRAKYLDYKGGMLLDKEIFRPARSPPRSQENRNLRSYQRIPSEWKDYEGSW